MSFTYYISTAIAIAIVITFLWRFLGMLSVGKMEAHHPLVKWATTIAFATVSALTVKLMFYPVNETLTSTMPTTRLIAIIITFIAFFLVKRNFIVATAVGMLVFFIAEYAYHHFML